MAILRTFAVAVALSAIGVVGVGVAVATASVFGSVGSWIYEFAFGWCTIPAIVLATLAFGLVHVLERVWPRLASQKAARPLTNRLLSAVIDRFRRRTTTGAATSSAFHTPVPLEPRSPPPFPILGILVSVPLAFLNLPGWLAVDHVVRGPVGVVAIFVVPGLVCGALVGGLAALLRQQRALSSATAPPG
jgi:hypothetical protein